LLVAGCWVASSLSAEVITESFEATAGWNWGIPGAVMTDGGAPGAHLEASGILDSALPKLATGVGVDSKFVGDYRAAGVRAVAATLKVDAVPTPFGRDLSVELTNDNGTPGNINDDCSAYRVGNDNIPLPGTGWRSYSFSIPAAREELPGGWKLLSIAGGNCPGFSDDEAWNFVITNVSQLKFSYGDPSLFYIFQQWEGLGLDSPSIQRTESQ